MTELTPNTIIRSVCGLVLALSWITVCKAEDSQRDTFLKKYCYACHSDGTSEGGLELSALPWKLEDTAIFDRWLRVFDRVEGSKMPPPDAQQPSKEETKLFLEEVGKNLEQTHAQTKGTVHRRLNRREYSNTLNAIFGTDLDLVSLFPEDGRSGEFDTIGESLSVSMTQVERYMEAIERVLDNAIAKSLDVDAPETIRASYAETQDSQQFIGTKWLRLDDGAIVFFQKFGYPTGMLRTANAKTTGRYKIRVTGYAYQSERPITFSIGATSFTRGADRPTFGYYSMPPGAPSTIEIEAKLEQRQMIEILPWGIFDDHYAIKKEGLANYRGPGLAIQAVELEGPLHDEFPSRGHRLLFDNIQIRELKSKSSAAKRKPVQDRTWEAVSDQPHIDAQTVLERVAAVAFRRPVNSGDLKEYTELFADQLQQGNTFDQSLRTAVAAIFCSPDFLFFREAPGKLDDYALASRLSYFLTRGMPDAHLYELASQGALVQDPKTLIAESERLLNDSRFQQFVEDFSDSWLNLRDIEFTSPDPSLFPEFDGYLQASMLKETRAFLEELIRNNLGIRNLVLSDFAMLNERLASHYEVEGVPGPEIRRVTLDKKSHRGGLLGQASVLKVSANGTNTSPVVRGVWVTERILGQRPDPPPAGVPGVEPDTRGALTLRQLLDKHRDSENCRACHAMIDPPGFALESFDPIGRWRDRFRVLGVGQPEVLEIDGRKVRYKLGASVDASGVLADGRTFDGYESFRRLIASDEATLARAWVTKLLTFATGREMGFSDRSEIQSIVESSAVDGYRMRDLLKRVVGSEIFRSK